ncbi:hypothetical protein QQX98_008018 [Neonectria punicea]|uniref:Uncharacterized protein n=1 Tax=Neonectria punicea TaxID=979145 RepID=A0ABR1GWT0_9HYPO
MGHPIKSFFARLQLIGLLSLGALLASSIILIFVACNAGAGYLKYLPDHPGARYGAFSLGADLSVQAWLAIVGVGFGLLSYGLHETYAQFFDLWCSRQAKRRSGLDYARYLNSQPRAPVLWGVRGFPVFVNLQRVLTLLTVGASIGYKFGITQDKDMAFLETVSGTPDDAQVPILDAPQEKMFENGVATPWLSDDPEDSVNRSFLHKLNVDYRDEEPPSHIMMAGTASCNELSSEISGTVFSLQHVVIANLTEEDGSFTMTQNSTGWFRTQTSNPNWITKSIETTPVVVDYRVLKPNGVQIQWARFGNWYTNDDSDDDVVSAPEPVVRRLTYRMYPATAIVARTIEEDEGCSLVDGKTKFGKFLDLITDINATAWDVGNETLVETRNWIDAFIYNPETTMRDGVSAFVRASMSQAYQLAAQNRSLPWASDRPDRNTTNVPGLTTLPYITGDRIWYPTVCRWEAMIVYLTLGILALLVGILRVALGPPTLTSWMGQHVYLALGDVVTTEEKPNGLRSGYEVAGAELGSLRLPTDPADGQSRLMAPVEIPDQVIKGTAARKRLVAHSVSLSRHCNSKITTTFIEAKGKGLNEVMNLRYQT